MLINDAYVQLLAQTTDANFTSITSFLATEITPDMDEITPEMDKITPDADRIPPHQDIVSPNKESENHTDHENLQIFSRDSSSLPGIVGP